MLALAALIVVKETARFASNANATLLGKASLKRTSFANAKQRLNEGAPLAISKLCVSMLHACLSLGWLTAGRGVANPPEKRRRVC